MHRSRSVLASLAIASACASSGQPNPAAAQSAANTIKTPSLAVEKLADEIVHGLPCPFGYPSALDEPTHYKVFKEAGSLESIERRYPSHHATDVRKALDYLIFVGEAKRYGTGAKEDPHIYHRSRCGGG